MVDELERSILGERNHEIDALERREHVSALGLGPDGTRRAFQAADRRVSVHTDNERIPSGARGCQQVDVARMK